MPISVNDLRTFQGTDGILFVPNDQGGTLQSVDRWQTFKSAHAIGEAQAQNSATLDAIREAFRNDPDLASDLKTKADKLLDQVRIDRAIGVAQIKGIVKEIDGLATAAALDERIQLRFNAIDVPEVKAYGDAAVAIAKKLVDRDVQGGMKPGAVDVPARVREAAEACRTALQSAVPDTTEPEPELVDLVGKNLLRFVLKPDGSIRSKDEIQSAVQKTCNFYFRAAESAQQALVDSQHFPDAASLQDAQHTVSEARRAAMEFLRGAGEPVDEAMLKAVEDHVRTLPMQELRNLGPSSSASEILGAIRAFSRAADPATMHLPDGVQLPSTPGGQAALMRFISRWAALQMPTETRRALHDLLLSAAAGKAMALPAQMAAEEDPVPAAVKEDTAGNALKTFLHKLEGNPGGPLVAVPRDAKITDFSPADRCAYRPENAFSGSAALKLRANLLGKAGILAPGGDPVKRLHDRIDSGARRFLDGYFAKAMKELAEAIDAEFKDDTKKEAPAKKEEVPAPDGHAEPKAGKDAPGDAKPQDGKAPEVAAQTQPQKDAPADAKAQTVGDSAGEAKIQPPKDPAKDLDARFEHAFAKGFQQFEGNLATQPEGIEANAPLFRMPDGTMLPQNPSEARNVLARIATGKPDAIYSALSPEDRARANVFIALLSCDPFKAAERGVKTGLSPNWDTTAFALAGDKDVGRVFTVSGSAKDGFVIRCGRDHRMAGVTCTEAGAQKTETVSGAGSAAYMLEIRLSPADLDSLATRDWKSFKSKAFVAETDKPAPALSKLAKTVSDEFRFAGNVSASFALDFDEEVPSAARPMPAIHSKEELVGFIQSLPKTAQFGTVLKSDEAKDAAGVKKDTFLYRGIVFRADTRKPEEIQKTFGFRSKNPLTAEDFTAKDKRVLTQKEMEERAQANLTEAMGLGVMTLDENGQSTAKSWGATGTSGVSTAKSIGGAIDYRNEGGWFYVIDTTKLPDGEHAWDMENTVYKNKYKELAEGKEEETGGEVNCSRIPFDAIVGWVQISKKVDDASGKDARLQLLQSAEEISRFEFNPAYRPAALPPA